MALPEREAGEMSDRRPRPTEIQTPRAGSRSESAIHDDRSLQENRRLDREAEWDEWQWREGERLGMGLEEPRGD